MSCVSLKSLLKVFDILALFSVLHRRDFCARQMHQECNPSLYPAVCPDLHTGRDEILVKVTSTHTAATVYSI